MLTIHFINENFLQVPKLLKAYSVDFLLNFLTQKVHEKMTSMDNPKLSAVVNQATKQI